MSRLMDLDRGSDNETLRTFDPCTGKVDVNRGRGDETGTAKLGTAEREVPLPNLERRHRGRQQEVITSKEKRWRELETE